MNFDLGRMRALMAALGDPQGRFPAVHVAGTNGKGSVCALMAAALSRAGLRVGVYTSPHLEHLTERFTVGGHPITAAALERHTAEISRLVRSGALRRHPAFRSHPRPTQFEALTAIAFLWFAEAAVDVAVMEVGLGGRLDATNVLEHVAVSVITNIGFDHMAWLGDTLPAIAAEKAGILRLRTPVVTAADGPALEAIRRRAADLSVPVRVVTGAYQGPLSLSGPHQRTNAAVAAAALEVLSRQGFAVRATDIRSGFASASWPGRFERFTLGAGENRITVILDGAHNVPAARALAAALRERGLTGVTLVFGALADKDVAGMARVLSPLAARVLTVTAPSDRAVPAGALAGLAAWRRKARAVRLDAALAEAVRGARGGAVVATGSLYVVGRIRDGLTARRNHQRKESSP